MYINTTDRLGSISIPKTRVVNTTNISDWIRHVHDIEEVTADRVSETKANNHCILKSDFENMREIQYFERENISMSRPTLDSTPIGLNTTNGTTSRIDSIPVVIKSHFTISPSQIDLIPVRTKTHFTISPSPIYSIPVGTKAPEPTPLTLLTGFPEEN